MKKKEKKRPKKIIEQRKKSDRSITIIKDGRIIIQGGESVKK